MIITEQMDKISVLFLAANPATTNQLAIDEEFRAIRNKLYSSRERDKISLESAWSTRPADLLLEMNKLRPQVVHFSGHGTNIGDLVFAGEDGKTKSVTPEALQALFHSFQSTTRVVVLNACWSEAQGKAIIQELDCVIGMKSPISDHAAIVFAGAFYQALGFGNSVGEAFAQGQVALLLDRIPENNVPVLLSRDGTDPFQIFLLDSKNQNTTTRSGLPSNAMTRFSELLAILDYGVSLGSGLLNIGATFGQSRRQLDVLKQLARSLRARVISLSALTHGNSTSEAINGQLQLLDALIGEADYVLPFPADRNMTSDITRFKELRYRLLTEWDALKKFVSENLSQVHSEMIAISSDYDRLFPLLGFQSQRAYFDFITPSTTFYSNHGSDGQRWVIKQFIEKRSITEETLESLGCPRATYIEVINALIKDGYVQTSDYKVFFLTDYGFQVLGNRETDVQ